MRSLLLSALIVSAALLPVRADYVVIVFNLNAKDQSATPGATGDSGSPGGMIGGSPSGIIGGSPGPGGPVGIPPGISGPGGPGYPAGSGGPGYPPGSAGPGLMGYPGMPGMGGPSEADDEPYLIVVVLEGTGLAANIKKFNLGAPITFRHRWGGNIELSKKTNLYEAIPLVTGADKVLPNVRVQFLRLQEEATKNKAGTSEMLKLARWALEHGLTDEFVKVMDKLAEADKSNGAVAAYLKIKAALDRPVGGEAVASWQKRLLDGYRITESDKHHYALLHNFAPDNNAEAQALLDRLEQTFRNFYYWWALNGTVLALPATRQVAVVAEKADDYRLLQKRLAAGKGEADSFVARREGLAVFASKRGDAPYTALAKVSEPMWEKGFDKARLVTGTKVSDGIPKELTRGVPLALLAQAPVPKEARAYAVLLKAMEEEWEANAITHKASRQLVFASGLLPRNVNAPEWLQFGLGSFFEVPLQSPWGGPGAANPYWLPRFKEYYGDKKKAPYGATAVDALIKVVTDGVYRSRPVAGDTREAQLRRARAASWALTFFLAHRDLEGLRRYCREMARMPRDLELDDKVLLGCFARAFDCANPDGSVNRGKLATLAERWIGFLKDQALEADAVHKKIRSFYAQMNKPGPKPAGPVPPGGTPPGYPPGLNVPGSPSRTP